MIQDTLVAIEKKGAFDGNYSSWSSDKKKLMDDRSLQMFGEYFSNLSTVEQNQVLDWNMFGLKAKVFRQRDSGKFETELKDGKVVGTTGVLIDTKPDLYNDICTKACLKDMVSQITERKITMDLEHETFRGESNVSLNKAIIPISKITGAEYVENKGHAHIQIKDKLNTHNARYDEVAGSIQDKYLTAYSIAYRPEMVSYKSINGTEFRVLDKVTLLNVTYTGVPVNPRAEIGGVQMKSFNEDDEIFTKLANGEGVDAKAVGSDLIEAKSKVESKDSGIQALWEKYSDDTEIEFIARLKRMGYPQLEIDKHFGYTNTKSKGGKMVDKTVEVKATDSERRALFKKLFPNMVYEGRTSAMDDELDRVSGKSVEVKADAPPAEQPAEAQTPPATPDANSPNGEGNSLENVLKEILARLGALEAKVSQNDTAPEVPEEKKAEPEAEKEPAEEKEPKEDAEQKAMKITLAELKSRLDEQDKILSRPDVKARLSSMEAEIKSQEATAKVPSLMSMM